MKGRVTILAHSARHLMLIDIYIKFREWSFRGFQIKERTRFMTRQTDARGKTKMSLDPEGGRHYFGTDGTT